ncbi:hypothetical protein NQ315_010973 [Exocentrus adspersus]|uniref:RNA-directed DNA polymerase n=1 Tax=Exocentrus adspersus TaxID=1586481 RepID=A0AAV8VG04_9CUCU|nr:hypothetical protein NQ315_010973 [Exocentrus adspersus]
MSEEAQQTEAVKSTLEGLFRTFIEHMDSRSNVPVALSGDIITLPKFVAGRDEPQQWIDEVLKLASELKWNDSNIMARVSGCFEGEAEADTDNNLMPEGWLAVQQGMDSETIQLKERLASGEIDCNQFCLIGSTLCHIDVINSEKVTQYFVPKNARYALLKEYHDGQAHIGLDKTVLSICSHFWFPRIRQFARKYIDGCLTCLTRKRTPRAATFDVHSIPKVPLPFNTMHVDCFGPLPETDEGCSHIFVAVDAYSKYCFLYALKSLKTDDIADCIQDIIFLVGTPARIITDNGASLKALLKHDLLTEWNIEWHFITPYVHQANGQAERYMQFIANLLRVQAEVTSNWSALVSRIQLVINSTVHKTTGRTPLQTLFGCDNRLPEIQRVIDTASNDKLPVASVQHEKWRQFVSKRIEENATRQESYVNKGTKAQRKFKVGDYVLVSRKALKPRKFESGWTGPYRITAILSTNRYELRRVGDVAESTRVTAAAACQMRIWAQEWSPEDCADVLESYITENAEERTNNVDNASSNSVYKDNHNHGQELAE